MWQVKQALAHGLESMPEAGDRLQVICENTETGETKHLGWTYDGEQTVQAFVVMVRREVHLFLEDWNTPESVHDVTDIVFPPAPEEAPKPRKKKRKKKS